MSLNRKYMLWLRSTAWFNLPRKAITLECDGPFSSRSSRQATLEASTLSGALPSAPFGREFSAALDKAKAASLGVQCCTTCMREALRTAWLRGGVPWAACLGDEFGPTQLS